MNLQSLRVRSLKARMTLSTLAIFLVSMWALSYYAATMLREDIERTLGQQQLATVSLLANQIEEGLNDRVQALMSIAAEVTPAILDKPATLQTMLEQRRLLVHLFNGGIFVTGTDGTAIVDTPLSTGRIGINYMDRPSVSRALREGKVLVGAPAIGKILGAPAFSILAPIQDADGKVLGVLVGTINLGLPNFMDKVTQSTYGRSGGYLLVARDQRLVVAATDKRRIMQPVGTSSAVRRYIGGHEGSDVFVNSAGVEVLSSVKGIPVANWYLAASLPTSEAFAPIREMQQRMLWATIVLSVMACGLTWWLLRRQLFPVLATVEKLAIMANEAVPLAPLPVPEQTEVGALITGLNRVLKTLEQREAALLESDAFRNAIIDSVAAEIVVLDSQGVIAAVNQPWRRFGLANGLEPESVGQHADIGTDYLKVCRAAIGTRDEDFAVQAAEGIQAVLDRRLKQFNLEYPCDAPDEKRWFTMIVTPLDRPRGGAVVAHSNITDLKNAEERIRHSEERLTRMQLGATDGFWDLDLVHNQMFYSTQWWKMLGFGDGEHSSDPNLWLGLLHPDDVDRTVQAFNSILFSGINVGEATFRLLHTDGHYVPIECRGVISRDPSGKAIRVSGSNLDLTERKRIEAQLLAAKDESEMANDAKSHFLAAVSHDLRQPLAALTLYVGMLDAEAPGRLAELVPRIKDCAGNLGGLLGDLLDLSKLQAGAVAPALTCITMTDLLDTLESVHAAHAKHKGLRFRVRPSTLTLRTDRTLMSRLLGNLVANAVQYTSSGGVLIACRRHARTQWLEVYDTGIGFAEDKIESIFAEFSQLNRNSGSGLGLYIVGKTAELLGLQIRVRSVEGRGSMFAVELPIAAPILPTSQPVELPLPGETRLRVALVDDHTEVLQALTLALENLGHEVIAATTGMDVIARLHGIAPDLIITDYHLAYGETGDDVIEDARAIFGEALPALMVTADTDKVRIRSLFEEGIVVLIKPIQIDALRAAMAQVMGRD